MICDPGPLDWTPPARGIGVADGRSNEDGLVTISWRLLDWSKMAIPEEIGKQMNKQSKRNDNGRRDVTNKRSRKYSSEPPTAAVIRRMMYYVPSVGSLTPRCGLGLNGRRRQVHRDEGDCDRKQKDHTSGWDRAKRDATFDKSNCNSTTFPMSLNKMSNV